MSSLSSQKQNLVERAAGDTCTCQSQAMCPPDFLRSHFLKTQHPGHCPLSIPNGNKCFYAIYLSFKSPGINFSLL